MDDPLQILYVKTHKTGSTFIADLIKENFPHTQWHVYPTKVSENLEEFNERQEKFFDWDTFYDIKLSSVRNPYNRCVSTYRWFSQIDDEYHRESTDIMDWIDPNENKIRGFKNFLKTSFEDLRKRDHYAWEVSLPVFDLCNVDGAINYYDKIIKCENMKEDIEEVFNRFGITNIDFDGNYDINSSGDYNLLDYYDDENKHLVYKKYEKDFKFFSYDKNSLVL